ncbi:MAG TPA: DUF2752 domain-containing protein [Actinocrinis sp.]
MIAIALPRRNFRLSGERLALTAVSSLAAAWIQQHHNPGVICPLRRLTGVPCPICGSTTVFMEAGGGHWAQAVLANPFTVAAWLVFLLSPALALDPVRSALKNFSPRTLWIAGAAVGIASWLWQLHRFGFL